ncbi:testis-expressed protein 47 isoform X1 [Seriola aureovittata]|uniref:testis-expressed protein 47 isoform X1 n=1 Tax=Seriola aureovittata TaxID=2871759 RepID=UPI0024BE7875|nr:testis-expressed protein 47 isoform X1 [Seriola aureovittata]XP_056221860.1 testis-expressed protein 47 isoform X1 [Seriola aureovittata]XP_056221861.1 testis-expressed protein 47 isoform X1 [Seriola aureovittata]
MAAPQKVGSLSLKSWENRDSEVEGRDTVTMFDVFHGTMREKIVLQRLIVIARLPHDLTDRTELGAHYEKLNFQLSKQYIWDHMTGLLVIYPSCLLHIIESSREILLSVLKDLQQQTDCSLLEAAKVVFMAHEPRSRMFHQWSYKVLGADQVSGDHEAKGHEEEEESTETLVCSVLSALQSLGEHPEISKKTLPGLVLDETPELIMPQEALDKLLDRDELQSPQQFLQMYDSPLNVSMDFGQVIRSRCLTTV